MITLWRRLWGGDALGLEPKFTRRRPGFRRLFLKKSVISMRYRNSPERERARLVKWQVAQEGQINACGAAGVVLDRVRTLILLIGEYSQRCAQIGLDGHVELGLAERGNDEGPVADAAGDRYSVHLEFHVHSVHRQRLGVG